MDLQQRLDKRREVHKLQLEKLMVMRRSVRKYDMIPLEESLLIEIGQVIRQIAPLILDGGNIDLKIVSHADFFEKTSGMFRVDAPHYILLFGDGSDDAYKNIGYVGELIVLELTKRRLGTCWLGGAKSSEEAMNDTQYAISIAFGKTQEGLRTDIDDFKRKELKDIATNYTSEQEEMLKYARIAPSAVNFQPWYFQCQPNQIHVFRKRAPSLMTHLQVMQKIDIGIVIAHFTTQKFEFKKLDVKIKGKIYEGTLCFEQ